MLTLILNAYARNLSLLRRLVAGMNHPAWIIGHLAWASDRAAQLMGLHSGLPAGWPERFDSSSAPLSAWRRAQSFPPIPLF